MDRYRSGAPDAHYLALVERGDRDGAIDHVLALLDSGWSLASVVTSVLAPVQVEVGRRWEANELTVADEHAASGICDAVLAVAAAEVRRRTSPPASEGCPRVVAACVEDEWHALPLRMAAEVMTCDGIGVTFLGPSVPASHLSPYLEVAHPDACMLSCTMISHLPSLRRCIDAAHAAKVPVIAGGRALGEDGWRARRLDADAWTNDASEAAGIARRWTRSPPPVMQPSSTARATPIGQGGAAQTAQLEVAILERPTASRIDAIMDGLLLRYPDLASFTADQLEHTREDLVHVLRHAAAALVVEDPALFLDFTAWLVGVLGARKIGPDVVAAAYAAIRETCRDELVNAALLLQSAEDFLA